MLVKNMTFNGEDWVSINQFSGFAVGLELLVQNDSNVWFRIQESDVKPDPENNDGFLVTDLYNSKPAKRVTAGSLEIWVKSASNNPLEIARLAVQQM